MSEILRLRALPRTPEAQHGFLRAGALLILNELDDSLAGFEATRLLVDGLTDPMSGEPALTAVRALASQGQAAALLLRNARRRRNTTPRGRVGVPPPSDSHTRCFGPRHHRLEVLDLFTADPEVGALARQLRERQ
jgi:hypothetical protein